MGLFKALKSVAKGVVNTALLPVTVAVDIVTFGGLNTDQQDPYTVQQVKKIGRNIDKAVKNLDD